jgi:hypothetical protein
MKTFEEWLKLESVAMGGVLPPVVQAYHKLEDSDLEIKEILQILSQQFGKPTDEIEATLSAFNAFGNDHGI